MRWKTAASTMALGAALLMYMSGPTQADPVELAAAGGTITGKVVDADGKPVANAPVRVMKPRAGGPGGGGGGASGQGGEGQRPQRQPKQQAEEPGAGGPPPGGPGGGSGQGPGGGQRPQPVAETTTGDDGTFTLENVPAGDYAVVVQVREKGQGRGQAHVTDGGVAKVDIKLQPRPQGGQGGGGGQGPNGGSGGQGGGGSSGRPPRQQQNR